MLIRTKIVATLGPASGNPETLKRMVEAGCDVFRINFSHGDDEQRERLLRNVRDAEAELRKPLAVMGDLCGPKIRVGNITGGSVLLEEGEEVIIQREPIVGGPRRISTTLSELIDEAEPGQILLLDEGKIRLEVVETNRPREIACRIICGGVLRTGSGMNLPQTALKLSALTEKDLRDVKWIAGCGFDYVGLSFVRSGGDILELRRVLGEAGSDAHVVAKIEKPQAVNRIDEILDAADAVMVARGDLGVEMELSAVPIAQKQIARLSQTACKPCIIATQMLESMTHSPTPTRAEVSDVANAVLDHTDAVMLSGETAVGKFPVEAVRMMDEIVKRVESHYTETVEPSLVTYAPARTTAALGGAVRHIIEVEDIAAVAVFTASGATARVLGKNRIPRPILAMSQNISTVRRMCLYYGVAPVHADAPKHTRDILKLASKHVVEQGIARAGEKIVVLSGRPIGKPGATNTLVVHTVG